MSRARDAARRQAEEQARARRHSAAHRALRRRAQRGSGAHAVQADAPSVSAGDATGAASDAEQVPEPHVDRTPTSELTTPEWLTESADGAEADAEAGASAARVEHVPDGDPHDDASVTTDVPTTMTDDGAEQADATSDDATEQPGDEVAPADADAHEAPHAPTRTSVFAPPADAGEPGAPSAGASAEPSADAGEPSPVEAGSEPSADAGAVDDEATAVHEPVVDTAVLPPVPPSGAELTSADLMGSSSLGSSSASEGDTSGASVPSSSHSAAPHSVPDGAGSGDDGEHGGGDGADGHGRPRRRMAWIVPLSLAVLLVLYVGAQALLSTTVPRGTETLGVEIGGLSSSEATGEVSDAAAAVAAADLELWAAEQSFALPASDAGLAVDAEQTVAQVTGFTLMPDRLWAHIAGGGPVEPVVEVDDEALADAVESAAVQIDGPAQDAGVAFAEGAVEVVPGRSAVTVDQEESASRVTEAWPAAQSVELVAQIDPPSVTDEDAADFANGLESQTLAAPITLVGDEAEATIEPATIAATSTVQSGPMGLELVVDGATLAEQIIADNPQLTTDGQNASVSFDDDHQIVIDEGSPGITIDGEALGDAVIAAAGSVDRLGELPYTAADPEVSAEDLGLADFQEVISSFDTPLTAEPVRTQNLRTAAADVAGVILQPGDEFDLTEVLSPINEEEGYQPAHVIVNGILTTGMGGGLSQMATTAYNAGYFAGYELIDHRPHSVWFTRYPAGRESTIYTGSINVVFRNNTPYAAVFNSYIDGGRLHVDVWSTPHFEVNTSASPKRDVREPGVKEVTAANCEPKGPGQPGFTITNTRTVLLDGEQVEQTSDTWTYKPDDAIRCVSEDEEDDD